jgi:hypothetical protein
MMYLHAFSKLCQKEHFRGRSPVFYSNTLARRVDDRFQIVVGMVMAPFPTIVLMMMADRMELTILLVPVAQVGNSKHRIELWGLSKARPISCSDSPAFQRFQILLFSTARPFPSCSNAMLWHAILSGGECKAENSAKRGI